MVNYNPMHCRLACEAALAKAQIANSFDERIKWQRIAETWRSRLAAVQGTHP